MDENLRSPVDGSVEEIQILLSLGLDSLRTGISSVRCSECGDFLISNSNQIGLSILLDKKASWSSLLEFSRVFAMSSAGASLDCPIEYFGVMRVSSAGCLVDMAKKNSAKIVQAATATPKALCKLP
jgi:hypothetical protein